MEVDYSHARKELQQVSRHFAEIEVSTVSQLRTALDILENTSAGYDRRFSVQVPPKPALRPEKTISHAAAQRSMPALQIYCLGRFQVRIGGQSIEHWRSVKAKSLLKYLVSRQKHTAPKDILMEALWPDCEPSLANNNLKATVKLLREALDDSSSDHSAWVLFQGGNYLINSAADLWVDVEEFRYRLQAGRQLENAGEVAEAMAEYKAAEAIYQGDYLEDSLYEEWTSLQREALKDEYLGILGKLCDYSMQEPDYEACAVYCKKILSKDICSEDAYRHLICCHSRLGQRNRAINWYRLCEKTLKAELGVSPDQRMVALYQKLLRGESI
jgi:DNA-binding SARP family transcriptional activator